MGIIKSFFSDGSKISSRFRIINIIMFILVSSIISATMFIMLSNITNTVSQDYAELYSIETASSMNTYFGREIALLNTAANSRAVVDWFDNEFDFAAKQVAYDYLMSLISVLGSDNIYIGIERTKHEYSVEEVFTINDIEPFPDVRLMEGHYDDAWYFDCIASDLDYQLNVDIDKIFNRKLVWLNYKVASEGKVYGVICTGLEFSSLVEGLFSKYDNKNVRAMIIDENGHVQMDSISLNDDDFIKYAEYDSYHISDDLIGISDAIFNSSINEYLGRMDGYFTTDTDTIVVELKSGQYDYATIAPISGTLWSVVTFYDSSSLFNMSRLLPLFIIILALFVVFIIITNIASLRLIFIPFENIMAELRTAYEKTKEQNQIIMAGINYASKIQKNLLPGINVFENAFSDYSIKWNPRDIVGGDIYWLKNFDKGTVLCVCDCTGHGTPGALLTMLVISAFEDLIIENNCNDTAGTLWNLEQRLVGVFRTADSEEDNNIKDGCDLAVLFIDNDDNVIISSSHIHVFVCDGNEVKQIKGQNIFIGEGELNSKDDINTIIIPANSDNKYYIASDGLFDQVGGKFERPYGYKEFKQIILDNHHEKQSIISDKIWAAFESYRSEKLRVDDFELITFKP